METGKIMSKSVMGRTREEVEKKLEVAISEVSGNRKEWEENYTTAEWMSMWFETYSKPLIRPSTAISYSSCMNNHILPNIGEIPIDWLTPFDIQTMYNKIKSSGRVKKSESMTDFSLSSRVVCSVHMLLRQCLEQAVKEQMIPYNPVHACKPPPKEKTEMKVMPAEKIGSYLKAADERGVLPMFFLALSSGLRRGELLALLWSDLNVKKLTISVTKQVTGRKGGPVVSAPKTPNSTRTVAIPRQAVQLLVAEHEKHAENPYLFPSPVTGKMYYPDSVGRLHKKILKDAGLDDIRFHDLRHTFATLALQNGVDIKTLSNMLGHCSAGFTLDTYAHVTDRMQREAASKMGKFMGRFVGD